MTIKVFTTEELLQAIEKNPSGVICIEKKKNAKEFQGTEFLDATFTVGPDVKKECWINIKNIELSDGVADPNDKDDKRTKFEGTRTQLSTTVSKSGSLGKLMTLMNEEYKRIIKSLVESKIIDMEGKKLHELMQSVLSKKNEKNPGGVIEDPIIRFQFDFNKFSSKHPHSFLRNTPKTTFYDARTEYTDKGKKQYKIATVEVDGKEVPVDETNIHLFVTKGSTIVEGRLMMPSVPVSGGWVSWPIVANKIVLMPGGEGGFSDEVYDTDDNSTLEKEFAKGDEVQDEPTPEVEKREDDEVKSQTGAKKESVKKEDTLDDDELNGLLNKL